MKQKIFTFLLIAATGFTACRKGQEADPDIKTYDEQQIQAYIAANGLTDFVKDTNLADSSGMYYKIINKGTGVPLEYSDRVSLVFTLKSFDGKYVSTDTIKNHIYNYLGHLATTQSVPSTTSANLPLGLQQAIKNILQYRDGSMRLLIPSRLAYGKAGTGTGSITNVNTRIAGNQSLEYYVHVIDNQDTYDDLVIRNYMTANSLTGYTKTASGLYYKILTPAKTGTYIDLQTTVSATDVGMLLNGTEIDAAAKTTATSFLMSTIFVQGIIEGLTTFGGDGLSISLIMPSRLGYGVGGTTTGAIPSNAPLRFDYQVVSTTH